MDEYLLKAVVLGHSAVGKNSLLLRYCADKFDDNPSITIGVNFKMQKLKRDDCYVKLGLWKCPGIRMHDAVANGVYRSTHGVIIVYDVTDRSSFDSVPLYQQEATKYAPDACVTLLCGNKVDLEDQRVVSTREGEDLANSLGLLFMETSAKDNVNVTKTFDILVDAVLETKPDTVRASAEADFDRGIELTGGQSSSWSFRDMYSCVVQ